MTNSPFVSVIIPVYKVEAYLRQCVDSVLAQTYTDFEVILVDDGSPDNCPAICDEYATKDSRVKVIHKENGGLSDARNAGIELANGEWLVFLDSDDKFADENVLSELYDFIKADNAKIVFCPKIARFSASLEPKFPNYIETSKLTPSQLFDYVQASGISFAGWLFVTNSHHIKEQNLYFTKGILHEDMDWIPRVLATTNDLVSVFPHNFYLYRMNDSSITSCFNAKRFESIIYIANCIVASQTELNEFKKKWLNMLFYSLYINMSEEYYSNRKLYKEHLRTLIATMKKNCAHLSVRNKIVLSLCSRANSLFYKFREMLK